MAIDWNAMLKLPEQALLPEKKVDKTTLIAQGELTKAQQKMLDAVKRLSLIAAIQKSTTRISSYKDEYYIVESIPFLSCELRTTKNSTELIEVLHSVFPNPTLLLMEFENQIMISVALTRRSMAEKGKMVLEKIATSPLFDPSDHVYGSFIDALAYYKVPQNNLLEYVSYLYEMISLSKYVQPLGFFPVLITGDFTGFSETMKEYERCSQELRRLETEKHGAPIGIAAKLRVSIDKLEQEQHRLSERIKEYCNA